MWTSMCSSGKNRLPARSPCLTALPLPPIAGVAGGAARPVGLDADAEVVQEIGLADGNGLLFSFDHYGVAEPGPVGGHGHLMGGLGVAFEAGLGHLRPAGERALAQAAVGGMLRMIGGKGAGGIDRPRLPAYEGCEGAGGGQ